jgi:hypothetical protein
VTANDPADELYALPPEAFTSARDALAKAADRDDAKAIKALRKPSLVAWALNQLVRQQRSAVEELIGLGNDLRAAQEALAGDDLRALGRQRHQLVRAVAGQAADLAAAAGRPLSPTVVEQVATSLDAALTDPGNAQRLLKGTLSSGLDYAGLGEAPAALSLVPGPAKSAAPKDRATAKQLQIAKAALTSAEKDLAEAERAWTQAREALAAAHLRAGTAEERLAAAREEWDQAQASEEEAEKASQVAGRGEQIASLRVMQARQYLDELAP